MKRKLSTEIKTDFVPGCKHFYFCCEVVYFNTSPMGTCALLEGASSGHHRNCNSNLSLIFVFFSSASQEKQKDNKTVCSVLRHSWNKHWRVSLCVLTKASHMSERLENIPPLRVESRAHS